MKKISTLYRMFEICFVVFFSLIVVLIIFFNEVFYYQFESVKLLLSGILGIAFVSGAFFLISKVPRFSTKREVLFVSSLLFLYLLIQIFIGWELRVATTPAWDFGVVYSYAEDYVKYGALPDEYFNNFSGNSDNATIYLFLVAVFSFLSMFGIADFLPFAIIINALFINVSIMILYLTARRLVGVNGALFSLFLSFCTTAFIGYVPIIYSDTLSLPFAILGVYLYICARDSWGSSAFKIAFLLYFATIATISIGYGIKQTLMIIFVAIIIDVFLQRKIGIKQLFVIILSVVLIICATWVSKTLIFSSTTLPDYDEDSRLPLTHWIMMGLDGLGGYNDDDIQYTLSFDTYEEKQAANLVELEKRLNEMGIIGFVQHLTRKLSYTYGDSTYTVALKLDRGPIEIGALHDFFIWSGEKFKYFALWSFGIALGTFFWLTASAYSAIRSRDYSTTFLRVAIFGLSLFLLIFETRSRYLVNYLPIFILCATCGLSQLISHEK